MSYQFVFESTIIAVLAQSVQVLYEGVDCFPWFLHLSVNFYSSENNVIASSKLGSKSNEKVWYVMVDSSTLNVARMSSATSPIEHRKVLSSLVSSKLVQILYRSKHWRHFGQL